ncbi:MAG TPA: site-2 protease family protein [bacterium]|nr:site-2 protease family protein [bacterium]
MWAVPVLFSIVVHEVSHGWVAQKLGDNTAASMGRLTLNPIHHIDILGTVVLPLIGIIAGGFIFGWAKPVPVNPYNFYQHVNLRKGMMWVALAGPASNLALAFVGSFVLVATQSFFPNEFAIFLLNAFVWINIYLAMFNLMPIPPLDGSKILQGILPYRFDRAFMNIERYGFFILIILLMTGAFSLLLSPARLIHELFLWIPQTIFSMT